MFDLGYTLQIVILGTVFLGAISGILGTFVVLRNQALIGDALSHATLPGIMIAYMLTGVRSLQVLLLGAFISALVAMFALNTIKKYTIIKFDASMALILSGFFGVGQVFLSQIQKTGGASQAGLSRFILGQAATMLRRDIYFIAIVALVVLFLLIVFWKELKLYIFDENFYKASGLSERFISGLLTMMVTFIIVIGIRLVGVILMSALIIAPPVAARQLSNRFYLNVGIAGFIGAMSGMTGTYLSATRANLPTGPVIALVLGGVVLFTLLASPRNGIVKRYVQIRIFRSRIKRYRKLIHLYENPGEVNLDSEEYAYFINHDYVKVEDGALQVTSKGMKRIRSIKAVD